MARRAGVDDLGWKARGEGLALWNVGVVLLKSFEVGIYDRTIYAARDGPDLE
jgi:hypothetical protein